ncbi:ATP-dependent RNA helicase HrpA [Aeromicrobium sp. 179-A 4D2 NHS]|uniref:ATP-dependent RNA helicase HrpA n=1 Tax=Aeromicrobium sp. 179-A 4D2 NHS TaxID=3142375 RepID=UPI00399F485C
MRLEFDPALPIAARHDEIRDAMRDHQVVVIAGETGSGKTTQLPKIAAELGRTKIAHTQPRRIAARSVAARIAQECDVELGAEVGYAVRFDDRSGPETVIRLVTDGLLLTELQHDRRLERYDTIIIDEAHERSLAIDFLLGYLRDLLPRRPDLKVVITSATIDVERFADLFATPDRPVPVIEVSGRTYPVEVRYRPLDREDDVIDGIVSAVRELPRDGDVLVFLPGERDIRDTAEVLEGKGLGDVVPLYGRLAAHEQQRVFQTGPRRRIVLATNVAETSITVPGIRFVVDPGLARISRFSARLKVQRLPIERISQASAAQRAGRCGRVADGICIRLYDEEDFESRPEFTDPEILRTNLASVMLQMAALELGDIREFGFLDAPDHRAVADGLTLLRELGALAPRRDGGDRLTKVGRTMSRLPLDPRHARMVLAADRLGVLPEVLVIVAGLSIQDVRERPLDKQQAADLQHKRFAQPDSDFLSLLALWRYLQEQRDALSHTKFRRMCHDEFLHYLRVREWADVNAQLRRTVRELGLKPGKVRTEPDADAIHQALLHGLLSHVGLRDPEGREYLGARGARFAVFPGSGLAKKPPRWIMAGELVETSRLWARDNARVDPEWIEKAAGHLLKHQYAEPRWSARRGAAVATQRSTLYGIPVVVDRTVMLSKHDAPLARELFIRHALVGGEWRTHHRFWKRNQDRLAKVEELEERVRTRGIRVDDETLVDFYDARIPADIVSVRHFDAWWKKQPDKSVLDFTDDLFEQSVDADAFPTEWTSQSADFDATFDVSYRFDPQAADDGITITVPVDDLLTIDADEFAWGVPGRRLELVTELIRGLPKAERRRFAPAAQTAERVLPRLDPANELRSELARALEVDRRLIDPAGLPAHLRPTFRVVDGEKELAQGKDLEALRTELEPRLRRDLRQRAQREERTGIKDWDFGDLDRTLTAGQVTGYPAVVDEGDSVALRVLRTPAEQQVASTRGQARLIALSTGSPVTTIGRSLSLQDKLLLATSPQGDAAAVIEESWLAALDHLVVQHGGPVWDEAAYRALREKARADAVPLAERIVRQAIAALQALGDLAPGSDEAGEDVRVQVSWLVHPGFIRDMGADQVGRLQVYLRAAAKRLTSPKDPGPVWDLEARFHELTKDLRPWQRLSAPVQRVRWMLEELRVSTFAQELRAVGPISAQRVSRALDELGREI